MSRAHYGHRSEVGSRKKTEKRNQYSWAKPLQQRQNVLRERIGGTPTQRHGRRCDEPRRGHGWPPERGHGWPSEGRAQRASRGGRAETAAGPWTGPTHGPRRKRGRTPGPPAMDGRKTGEHGCEHRYHDPLWQSKARCHEKNVPPQTAEAAPACPIGPTRRRPPRGPWAEDASEEPRWRRASVTVE